MIFVTVGTHEQQFNRLIKEIDRLKKDGEIKEEVFIQTGYSTYTPQYCKWKKMLPYDDMQKLTDEARIVVTHGGPSSFLAPLQKGKIPVVVPRKKKYDEHVNDHQVEFVEMVSSRKQNIIPVYDIKELGSVLKNYNDTVKSMPVSVKSNNARFNQKFEKIVDRLLNKQQQRDKNGKV